MPTIPVRKIMTKDVITLEIPGDRDDFLDTSRKTGKSAFPVVSQGTKILEGMISRVSLFNKPSETQLSLLMKRDFPTIKPTDTVLTATKQLLENNVSQMPVVNDQEGKELQGIVSITDIVNKVISSRKVDFEIKDYFKKEISAAWEETPAQIALRILRLSGQDALPVYSSEKMIGIVTYHDFIKIAEVHDTSRTSTMGTGAEFEAASWDSASVLIIGDKKLEVPSVPVREIMERNVVVAYSYSTVKEIAKRCKQHTIDQLPVVDAKGGLIGIIDQTHLLRAFLDFAEQKI